MKKCCLCEDELEDEFGNNPAPLMRDTDGKPNRCCDVCNATKVIPARLKAFKEQGDYHE